ncbi:MAG: hypothetical protein WDO18_16815 [Acidobacteriota bacterium]
MSNDDAHYDHEVTKHDPKEGFDPTEPEASRITFFVVISVITLVVVIGALQNYFDVIWNTAVEENVTNVAPPELKEQRSLENWRFTHYEYTTDEKKEVRLPLDRAMALVLEEAKQGKTFYPAKSTTPVPETPAPAAGPGAAPVAEVAKK